MSRGSCVYAQKLRLLKNEEKVELVPQFNGKKNIGHRIYIVDMILEVANVADF